MSYLNYLIEANLALIFFYAMYWLLLRKENQFAVQRISLMCGLLLSLVVPIIHFDNSASIFSTSIPKISEALPEYWLPEVVVGSTEAITESSIVTSSTIFYVYLGTSLVLFVFFGYRITKLLRLAHRSRYYVWNHLKVYEIAQHATAFSFFNLIFLGVHRLTAVEKDKILHHEAIHARYFHSFDIVLIHLVRIAFWFNPVVFFYQKSLTQLHEYEADAKAVRPEEANDYCELLAKTALISNDINLVNHFSNSLTIKRISMLKTLKNKISGWKLIGLLGLAVALTVAISCQDQLENKNLSLEETQWPTVVTEYLKEAKQNFPNAQFEVMKQNGSEKIDYESAIVFTLLSTPVGNNYLVLMKDSRYSSYPKDESFEFHNYVEERAKPMGGLKSFYDQLSHAIIYPEEAVKSKYEDKVFVEFIVNTDGKLSDFKVIKGKYEVLNTEAERVMLQMMNHRWLPAIHEGRIVRQKLILPITFNLTNQL